MKKMEMKKMEKDQFTRNWIIENSIDEIQNYQKGVLTLRALHYRLVSRGMTNTIRHYKRVVSAMIKARWDGYVSFDTFSDHDREVLGITDYEETTVEQEQNRAEQQIKLWMESYRKNMWENQDTYIEIWIEKKALQGIFEPICSKYNVALAPCKGYPSLTFLNEAKYRFEEAQNTHEIVIVYFGDYDPSGEDIPRSIGDNLFRLGVDVTVDRRLLLEHQVIEWNLPPAPIKMGDSRSAKWNGLGQVELDAVEPKKLQNYIEKSILDYRNETKYDDLLELEGNERAIFIDNLKEFVRSL